MLEISCVAGLSHTRHALRNTTLTKVRIERACLMAWLNSREKAPQPDDESGLKNQQDH
jgi:hypothetical protein